MFEEPSSVTLRMHAQQGVKQLVCLSSVVISVKIAVSRDLGITATPKHNKSVEIFKKTCYVMLQIV